MSIDEVLYSHLQGHCPEIHAKRLQAVMDVATGLQHSRQLSISAIGRNLVSESEVKHRIKKVDRLVGNKHLYSELSRLYEGLSEYIFKYMGQDKFSPIVVDLCFLKDDHDIQMLSAEVATQGRTLPLYREVFEKKQLKGRAKAFLGKLLRCIPQGREVLVVMDAGFGEDWFEAIESKGWYWLVRARQGKYIKLSEEEEWQGANELFSQIGTRAKSYEKAYMTKQHPRLCRVITKRGTTMSKRKRPLRLPRNYNAANGNYQRLAKEPWILATNLPASYNATKVISLYKKRMQIEESFRDIKNRRYGLSGRDIQTRCVYRWSICMLLAAIVQITLWVIGVIAHSQGFQRKFQSNTVKDKKVFSYFYLGQLIIEFNKLSELIIDYESLPSIIETELARAW